MSFRAPSEYMVSHPTLGMGEGNNGFFQFERQGTIFHCLASDGGGWEHVSVSLSKYRCPTWDEMCMIKNIFWSLDDTVIQYHPAQKDYVNNHKYCLHLWRPVNGIFPIPDPSLVGVK